jgi:sigma-E factor negative regulatory protein RseC
MDSLISHAGSVRRIADGQAWVAVATGGCTACGHSANNGGGCSIGKLAGSRRETLVVVPTLPGLKAGDAVTLELSERQLTRAALFGYVFPVLLLIAGALLGQTLGEKVGAGDTADLYAVLGAAAGLAAGLLATRFRRPLAPRLTPTGFPISVSPLEQSHV